MIVDKKYKKTWVKPVLEEFSIRKTKGGTGETVTEDIIYH